MSWAWSIVPAFFGFFTILQAGLNRRIAQSWGIPSATFLNACVLILLAGGFLIFAVNRAEPLPGLFRGTFDVKNAAPWFVIPGILGFILIVGGPWALARFGAVHTFTLLISAQLLGSLAWDRWIEGIAISPMRVVGVVITWLGVLIAIRG